MHVGFEGFRLLRIRLDEGGGKVAVARCLRLQHQRGQFRQGAFHLAVIQHIAAVLLTGKGTRLLQIVENNGIRTSAGRSLTKTLGADQRHEERGQRILLGKEVLDVIMILQLANQ